MNEQETRELVATQQDCAFRTTSIWVADLILLYQETIGYPYISAISDWLRDAHKLDGPIVSRLIYNAQRYNEKLAPARAGFVPLTAEMVERAKKTKKKILIFGDIMGHAECRPGVANGSPCAFVGRSRTRFYPLGTPAKLAA